MPMNDDTLEQLYTFLEGRGTLPARVTNGMLLFAIRAERKARQQDHAQLAASVAAHHEVLNGKEDAMTHGLRYRVLHLERVLGSARWLLWPLASAFLGTAGGYLFELMK